MKLRTIILNAGKVVLKAGGIIAQFALEEMTSNMKNAYKDNKINQGQHDKFMTSSKKASAGLERLLSPGDKK